MQTQRRRRGRRPQSEVDFSPHVVAWGRGDQESPSSFRDRSNKSPRKHSKSSRAAIQLVEDRTLLSDDLRKLVNSEEYSDVVFIVGRDQTPVYAHRSIVASRSKVFAAMLYGGLRETNEREITVPNTPADIFISMMEYIYTGCIEIPAESAMNLLNAANMYGLLSLMKSCSACIQENLNASNVCEIMVQSAAFADITNLCMHFIEENSTEVFMSKNIRHLTPNILAMVLQSDNLAINEIELYEGIVEWGRYQCEAYHTGAGEEKVSLEDMLSDVIPHIRLPLISASDLVKIVKPTGVVPTDMYLEAIEYHAAPDEVDRSAPAYRRRVGVGPIFHFAWEAMEGFQLVFSLTQSL